MRADEQDVPIRVMWQWSDPPNASSSSALWWVNYSPAWNHRIETAYQMGANFLELDDDNGYAVFQVEFSTMTQLSLARASERLIQRCEITTPCGVLGRHQ